MEIRQLKYFVAVAEVLSFSRAADQLAITQSPLSRQIQKLEEELDCLLFDRSGGKLKLTSQGETFLVEARQIIASSEGALAKMKHAGPRPEEVRIGFMPFVMFSFLPDLLQYMEAKYPEQQVVMKEFYANQEAQEALGRGEIDILFHYPPATVKGIISEIVHREEFIMVMAAGHPKANRSFIEGPDLASLKFILPEASVNPAMMEHFMLFASTHGFKPDIAHQIGPHQARLALVAANQGVTIDGESVKKLNHPGVVYKRLHANVRQYAFISAAWRTDQKPNFLEAAMPWLQHRANERAEIEKARDEAE